MIKILASLLFLFSILCVFNVHNVKSQEVCHNYTFNGYFFKAQNCSNYCCGYCNNRYCCNDTNFRLDQEACIPENCTAYYDWFGVYTKPLDCGYNICCGACEFRYCCVNPIFKLNQSSCLVVSPTVSQTTTTTKFYSTSTRPSEKCESYIINGISHGNFNCPYYCCGTCLSRYCCDSFYSRLDQTKCTLDEATTKPTTTRSTTTSKRTTTYRYSYDKSNIHL